MQYNINCTWVYVKSVTLSTGAPFCQTLKHDQVKSVNLSMFKSHTRIHLKLQMHARHYRALISPQKTYYGKNLLKNINKIELVMFCIIILISHQDSPEVASECLPIQSPTMVGTIKEASTYGPYNCSLPLSLEGMCTKPKKKLETCKHPFNL